MRPSQKRHISSDSIKTKKTKHSKPLEYLEFKFVEAATYSAITVIDGKKRIFDPQVLQLDQELKKLRARISPLEFKFIGASSYSAITATGGEKRVFNPLVQRFSHLLDRLRSCHTEYRKIFDNIPDDIESFEDYEKSHDKLNEKISEAFSIFDEKLKNQNPEECEKYFSKVIAALDEYCAIHAELDDKIGDDISAYEEAISKETEKYRRSADEKFEEIKEKPWREQEHLNYFYEACNLLERICNKAIAEHEGTREILAEVSSASQKCASFKEKIKKFQRDLSP